MDALVMCGGRGTRLGSGREKPLTPVAGRPMIDRVLDALAAAEHVGTVRAVVSPHTPETREHLVSLRDGDGESRSDGRPGGLDLAVADAPGDGYVADLRHALEVGPTPPTLTVAADLPLLDGDAVDAVCGGGAASDADSLSVLVPAARKRELGASADAAHGSGSRGGAGDEYAPAGVNVVGGLGGGGDEAVRVTDDARLAVNVNYPADRRLAAALLDGEGPEPLPTGGIDWRGAPESGDRAENGSDGGTEDGGGPA